MKLFDYERASDLMNEACIDIILASTRPNVGYLADYWHTVSDDFYVLWDTNVTHKTLAGIPRDKDLGAFLIPAASEKTSLELIDPWIKERYYWGPGYYIQTWKEPNPDPGNPMDIAADVIKQKSLEAGCIAIEMRYLGVSYYERLHSLLPNARFVDAEQIMWELRRLKTSEEIRRTREACQKTCRAWRNVLAQMEEGITEKQMERLFMRAFSDEELEHERTYCVFGPSGLTLKDGIPFPSDNPLRKGQFIRVDAQGRYEGYMCNLSRVVAFDKISGEMENVHGLVKFMLESLIPHLKPGIRCSEIRAIELGLYDKIGSLPVVPYTGHGIGRVVHEPPYMLEKDHTVLEPNMIVTLEPTIMYRNKGDINICLEDTLLITEDGCERLTGNATLDLYL